MNILLWILQSLLALHTLMGAVWKFTNPAQNMKSLAAIPAGAWMGLSVVEILCAIGLVLPVVLARFSVSVPVAAGVIAAEMLLYCGLHLAAGEKAGGPMIYWLVVAALSACIAYGRLNMSLL